MSFNPQKCSVLRVTNKKRQVESQYTMCGVVLTLSNQETYLGLELTSNMSWGAHINKITAKSNRSLNMIRRNLGFSSEDIKKNAYQALVRPSLEYAHTVWDPYQANHINQVERIQRKAVRFIKGNYDREASVTAMRCELQLPTLQERRCVARLAMFRKVVTGTTAVRLPDYIEQPTRELRHHHHQTYINPQTQINSYQYSFFPRTIRCWNLLPCTITVAPSQDAFQSHLWKAIDTGQITVARPRDAYMRPRLGSSSQQQPTVVY